MNRFIVAIDGPAGSGKSSISKLVAQKRKFIHLDTGAMYRAVTLEALNRKIDLADEKCYDFLNDISEKLSDFICSIFVNSSGKECGNIVDDELNSQMLELSGMYYNFYNKTMEQLRPLVKLS